MVVLALLFQILIANVVNLSKLKQICYHYLKQIRQEFPRAPNFTLYMDFANTIKRKDCERGGCRIRKSHAHRAKKHRGNESKATSSAASPREG